MSRSINRRKLSLRAIIPLTSCGLLALGTLFASEQDALENDRHAPPHPPAELQASIDRGIAFLLDSQNSNGSWGSATNTKALNIYAPIPGAHHGFRAAVTALAVSALIESGQAADDPEIESALARGEVFLLEELPKVRRSAANAIYNVWTHAYGIRALVDMHTRALAGSDAERAA